MLLIDGSPTLRIRKRNGTILYALVDLEDHQIAKHRPWHMKGGKGHVGVYVANAQLGYLHRWVATRMGVLTEDAPANTEIDHKNGDPLDCRRRNLRLADRQQNAANRRPWRGVSQFMGVSWSRAIEAWQAHIMVDYKSRFLGYYEVEADAARAYDIAANAAFGEFARLNLPDRITEAAPEQFSVKRSRARAIASPTSESRPAVVGKSRFGASNGHAKLTEDQARQIVAELQKLPRRTQTSIAQQFGVSQVHISRIARKESWPHLW